MINSEFRSDPVTVRMPQCLNLLLSGRNDKVASGTGNRTVAFSLSLPMAAWILGGERARDSFSKAILKGSLIYHRIKQCVRRIDDWSHSTILVVSRCIFSPSRLFMGNWLDNWSESGYLSRRERQWYQLHNRQSCQITPRPERALKATKGRLSEKEERRLVV